MIKIRFVLLGAIILSSLSLWAGNNKKSLVERNNEFAFELFPDLVSPNRNEIISPISISTALAMTYEGARMRTASEMRTALHFEKNRKNHHKEFADLMFYYKNMKQQYLHISNALMAQEDYVFRGDFFALMKDYLAEVQYADFRNDFHREAARKALNNWVFTHTNETIKELIKPNNIDALTRLILVNAIHFKSDWQISFPPKRTRQMIFYSKPKQSIVHFMHSREEYSYTEDSTCKVIELMYKDSLASMIVFLPKGNIPIEEFAKSEFSYDYYLKTLNTLESRKVDVLLPKWKYSADYSLKEVLKQMGMKRAFTFRANFKGITGNKMLFISDVIHKSFIEVDETGTEAAGATAVIMREKRASASKPVFFNANRPFLYLIRDNKKGSILFIGTVVKP